jgi:hypothetical protein
LTLFGDAAEALYIRTGDEAEQRFSVRLRAADRLPRSIMHGEPVAGDQ